jgi:hypothetical protein
MDRHEIRRWSGAVIGAVMAWGALGANQARAQVIDVIGHLPLAEYNQFINSQALKDWGNEPTIAVNPVNPNEIAITTFAYGSFIQTGPGSNKASLWYSTDAGADWTIRFPINQPAVPPGNQRVPNDQVIAYDNAGNLHAALLTFGDNILHGTTANPNNDGVNGRPASTWTYTADRVNRPAVTTNNSDQPWLVIRGGNVSVGYDSFRSGGVEMRASTSINNGANFTDARDQPISRGVVTQGIANNPGTRLAADQVGNIYSIFGIADRAGPSSTSHENYRLNMSSNGGLTWKFTNDTPTIGGKAIADGFSTQVASSFAGVNTLLGNITSIASDPLGTHVYVAYGMKDGPNGTGSDRIWISEFHPDGSGGLVQRADPVAASIPGQRSALPNLAVTDDGTLFLMYDAFDAATNRIHIHLASSTDLGLTFGDTDLYDFDPRGIPIFNGNRLLGDYQGLIALGNTVYGSFSARGNVNAGGINTTDKDVPFFFAIPEPASLSLVIIGGGLAFWAFRRRKP